MSRRTFLKIAGVVSGVTLGYLSLDHLFSIREYLTRKLNLKGSVESHDPVYSKDSMKLLDNKVVVVHDSGATNWDFLTGWYGDYVNQRAVDRMIERGVMELTKASDIKMAWENLIQGYETGKKIAIKVNFNNAQSYRDSHNKIDALIQPVNSIIKGLKTIGVEESDIWIYDASRPIPDRFINSCLYKNVVFYDSKGQQGRLLATFNDPSPDSYINFSRSDISSHKLTDVVVQSDYIINLPIMKKHGGAGVTLSMKNHLGSLNKISDLHENIYFKESKYSASYNPLIDINNNYHIKNKTVLIIGDGLYGNWYSNYQEPRRWKTFENGAPNLLFFSKNPVAIDSVMYDFLSAETYIDPRSGDYLHIAAKMGMGIHEHRSKIGIYSLIDYIEVDFDKPLIK